MQAAIRALSLDAISTIAQGDVQDIAVSMAHAAMLADPAERDAHIAELHGQLLLIAEKKRITTTRAGKTLAFQILSAVVKTLADALTFGISTAIANSTNSTNTK